MDGKAVIDLGAGQCVFAVRLASAADYQVFVDSAVGDDARVLPLRRTAGGLRLRTWTSVEEDGHEEPFEDWPLRGPRSTSWCLDFLKREGRTLELHHKRFKLAAKLEPNGWGVQEHRELCQYLTLLCTFDQIDVRNLAAGEAMFRRLQTVEFSYLEKVRDLETKNSTGGRLSLEEHIILGGMSSFDNALMISPSLLDHARSEAEKSASLAKNLRKAREEREALRKRS